MKRILYFFILCSAVLLTAGCVNLDPDSSAGRAWREKGYAITSISTIENLDYLLDKKGMGDVKTAFHIVMPKYKEPVLMINFDYPSTGPQGEPVTLSARFFILEKDFAKGRRIKGVTVGNHASIAKAGQCPTRSLREESIFSWMGYPVVMSDYYGFGASEHLPQSYLNANLAAKGNVDALLAVLHMLEDKGVVVGDTFYNIGYSEGGFNTVANLKYVSQHPELGIRFKWSFAGAGSYDINTTWKTLMTGKYPNAMIFVPITVVSANEIEHLHFDYRKIFKGQLPYNIDEWVLSKKYSLDDIIDKIGTKNVPDIVTDNMIKGTGYEAETLRKLFDTYSVHTGWTVPADSKLMLFHSTEDDVVPFENSQTLYDNLTGSGSKSTVKFVSGAFGGHSNAELDFAKEILKILIL